MNLTLNVCGFTSTYERKENKQQGICYRLGNLKNWHYKQKSPLTVIHSQARMGIKEHWSTSSFWAVVTDFCYVMNELPKV